MAAGQHSVPALTRNTGALVIGGDYRALGIVRSLGRHGIPVGVCTDDHRVAAFSRYTQWHLPWSNLEESRRVDFLLTLCDRRKLDGWLVFPTTDENAALIARHHSRLSARFRLTTPPWEIFRWAYDKRLTHRLAHDLGIEQPRTETMVCRERLANGHFSFPVILKPAFKPELNPFTSAKAWLVNSREELLSAYEQATRLVHCDIVMVQEFIPGDGSRQFSYAALCRDGEVLASVTARRSRQYPIQFGHASSYVESIRLPEVESRAQQLLKAVHGAGLAEVEFKQDPRDGRYKLLDINFRAWGWHTLGRRASGDFPYLMWRMLHGGSVREMPCPPGMRWVRMLTDIPAALEEMLRGRLSPFAYLYSLRLPVEFAIFAVDDPAPAIFDVLLIARLAYKRSIPNPQRAKAAA